MLSGILLCERFVFNINFECFDTGADCHITSPCEAQLLLCISCLNTLVLVKKLPLELRSLYQLDLKFFGQLNEIGAVPRNSHKQVSVIFGMDHGVF